MPKFLFLNLFETKKSFRFEESVQGSVGVSLCSNESRKDNSQRLLIFSSIKVGLKIITIFTSLKVI